MESRRTIESMNLHMVTPCAHSRVIKTARNRVVKRVQSRSILNSFHRQLFDLLVGVNGKVYSGDIGGDWACEGRHCALWLLEQQKTLCECQRASKSLQCGTNSKKVKVARRGVTFLPPSALTAYSGGIHADAACLLHLGRVSHLSTFNFRLSLLLVVVPA